jgi:hypothetical protein
MRGTQSKMGALQWDVQSSVKVPETYKDVVLEKNSFTAEKFILMF